MGKIYGYVKTNVEARELLRQVAELKPFGVEEGDLYSDGARRSSGFDSLLAVLWPGDVPVLRNPRSVGGLSPLVQLGPVSPLDRIGNLPYRLLYS